MAYREQTKAEERFKEPQSIEAEQAVLASVLKSERALHQVLEILQSEDVFYSPKHRLIFKAILDLYQRNEPCDITTVAEELTRADKLTKIGGRVYLVDLVEAMASTTNADAHARIVADKYMARRLISACEEISERTRGMQEDVRDLLDGAESSIFSISQYRHRKGFMPLAKLIPSTFEQIEEMQARETGLSGIPSGFTGLDIMTNGFQAGELIIVAGRPSMGKSSLVMNMAEHMAMEQRKTVGVFSLEMSAEQLALRMLCGRARVSQQRLRAKRLNEEEWLRLTRAGSLAEAKIFIDDSAALSTLELKAKARRLQSGEGAHVLIVDYIQMMHGSGRFENRQQEMSHISYSLKTIAKELGVPVIACSQLSRQVEQRGGEKRPQLSDLRESGAIEQDADVVMFVYRPELYYAGVERNDPKYLEVEGKAEIIVAKQRNGPTGKVDLAFVKEYSRFENLAVRPPDLPPGAEPVDSSDIPF